MHTVPPPTDTAHGALRRALKDLGRNHGGQLAVIDAAGSFTFADLWRAASARAAERRHRPGIVVPIPALSTRRLFIEVAAIWLNGGIPLPIDPGMSMAGMQPLLAQANTAVHTCDPWKAVVRVVAGDYRLLFTGGEPPTAPRKAWALGLGAPTPALLASPLHLNGPFEFAIRHLLQGGTVVTLSRFDPAHWARSATATRPTWAFLAPIQLGRLLRDLPASVVANATTSVQTLMHSAAPCPPGVRERLIGLLGGDRVAELYATAEYDGTFTRASSTTAGIPIPGAALRIVDTNGAALLAGTSGTIEGRSTAGLIGHYAGEPCTSANAWRTVGDQGHLDIAGRLSVTAVDVPGRAIVGGIKVALHRVETVLTAHPSVLSCDVRAAPDEEYGQVVTARVVTTGGTTVAQLSAYCAQQLRPCERPRRIALTCASDSSTPDGRPTGGL